METITEQITESLLYEEFGGRKYYRLGYREVLLDFGVEGVVWIVTRSRKVVSFLPQVSMQIFEWTDDVPIFDDDTFCLQSILDEEGIVPSGEQLFL